MQKGIQRSIEVYKGIYVIKIRGKLRDIPLYIKGYEDYLLRGEPSVKTTSNPNTMKGCVLIIAICIIADCDSFIYDGFEDSDRCDWR